MMQSIGKSGVSNRSTLDVELKALVGRELGGLQTLIGREVDEHAIGLRLEEKLAVLRAVAERERLVVVAVVDA